MNFRTGKLFNGEAFSCERFETPLSLRGTSEERGFLSLKPAVFRWFCITLLFAISLSARGAHHPQPLAKWRLKTDDTTLSVGVSRENQLCLYELAGAG